VEHQKVAKVELNRVEGPVAQCRAVTFTGPDAMTKAQTYLGAWSDTAPAKGEGYDKVDFTVTWTDGETYKGRYDLVSTGLNDDDETLRVQMWLFLRFIAGLTTRPAWMTDAQWAQSRRRYQENGSEQEAKKFLETHEV
jgi:hypothetical protein